MSYRPTVLMVDDDTNVLRVHRLLLSEEYIVNTAYNEEKALSSLSDETVAIILDIKMPGLSGFDICRKLKEINPTCRIIFYTAYQSEYKDGIAILNQYQPFAYLEKKEGSVRELKEILAKAAHSALHEKSLVSEIANQQKDAFLAQITHDLRNPLWAIMSYMKEIQLGHVEYSEIIHVVNLVQQCTSRLLNMVNDLLDLGKLESGTFKVINKPAKLSSILDEIGLFASLFKSEASIKFSVVSDVNPKLLFLTDANRLTRVLLNLLSNAFKYTTEGEIKLTITHHPDKLQFELEDTGPGIPESDQESIFDRYCQSSIPDQNRGSGLGLSICSEFISRLGGSIKLKSKVGEGSVFSVFLPLNFPDSPFDAEELSFQLSDNRHQHLKKNSRIGM